MLLIVAKGRRNAMTKLVRLLCGDKGLEIQDALIFKKAGEVWTWMERVREGCNAKVVGEACSLSKTVEPFPERDLSALGM
jgi:hypothetical protein